MVEFNISDGIPLSGKEESGGVEKVKAGDERGVHEERGEEACDAVQVPRGEGGGD